MKNIQTISVFTVYVFIFLFKTKPGKLKTYKKILKEKPTSINERNYKWTQIAKNLLRLNSIH